MNHFHIVWQRPTETTFDYASFDSEEEANQVARNIVRSDETWTVIEVEGECSENCIAWLTTSKPSRKSDMKSA